MEESRRQFIPGPGILMLAILLLGAVGALLLPLLAALGPLRVAARLSIREALTGDTKYE